ncbi:LysR substrate-binding domain-containing protein [Sphingomonas koreensis]
MLPGSLPSLNALRAFDAVARLHSFKAAASELAVNSTAVSHLVRNLEEQLGVRLLERTPRHVRPTPEGEVLHQATALAFGAIRSGVAAVRRSAGPRVLTVSATSAFLSAWLVPRLASLHRALPDLDLRLHASTVAADLRAGVVDLAIRYGRGPYPGLEATPLLVDEFVIVARAHGAIRTVADLKGAALIHIDGQTMPSPPPDWALWRANFGPPDLNVDDGLRFTDVALAIQAALAGHGVAILSHLLVSDALRAGLLVRPIRETLQGATYSLVSTITTAKRPEVIAFRAWLSQQLEACLHAVVLASQKPSS